VSGDVVRNMKAIMLGVLFSVLVATSAHATCSNGCPKGIGLPYPLAYFFGDGVLTNGEIGCIAIPNATTIPANSLRSVCTTTATTANPNPAATSQAVFTITDAAYGRAANTIATLTFGAGEGTCTLSQQPAFSVGAKDTICVMGPATADATLANVAVTIYSTTIDYP
jgi:hypothetical protein